MEGGRALPLEVRETSGLARSLSNPGLFWTHNDRGNGADLFAIDEDGELVRRVRLVGVTAVDWEDLETGPCEVGACLYVADTGDNDGEREHATIYRVQEPPPGASEAGPADAFEVRFPGGPRDAEALFILPTGELYLINKGRREDVGLYRYPGTTDPTGEPVLLERVRSLFPEPGNADDRVTAATATPDGQWVGIRTYRTLYIHRSAMLLGGGSVAPISVDLSPLREAQGEGLAMADDGTVWLSSEGEDGQETPLLSRLECTLPAG